MSARLLVDDPAIAPIVDGEDGGAFTVDPGAHWSGHNVQLDRTDYPPPSHGDIRPADPIRYSEWYAVGKPFPFPGMSFATTFSLQEWAEKMPMGFIRKPPQTLTYAPPLGRHAALGERANIEVPPAVAYGSMIATYVGEPFTPAGSLHGMGA